MSIYQLANARQHAHMDIACLQRRHDLASADAQRARDRQDDLVHPALFQDAIENGGMPDRDAIEMLVAQPLVIVDIANQHLDGVTVWRSEEHTSELQSLMRISYAVFCLKKKTSQSNELVTCKRLDCITL